jgi:hypothetical protein
MQHLPKKLPATSCPDMARFTQACNQCKAPLQQHALLDVFAASWDVAVVL